MQAMRVTQAIVDALQAPREPLETPAAGSVATDVHVEIASGNVGTSGHSAQSAMETIGEGRVRFLLHTSIHQNVMRHAADMSVESHRLFGGCTNMAP